jgi:hypothetical protein
LNIRVRTEADYLSYVGKVGLVVGSVFVDWVNISTVQFNTLMGAVERITGGLVVDGTALLDTVRMDRLLMVGGGVSMVGNIAVQNITFPSLLEIGGTLEVEQNAALASLKLPAATHLGQLYLNTLPLLTSLAFDALESCAEGMLVQHLNSLVALQFPMLAGAIFRNVYVQYNAVLQTVELGMVQTITGIFQVAYGARRVCVCWLCNAEV